MAVEPARLSTAARTAIDETADEVCVSVASIWELGIKRALGKLSLPRGFSRGLAGFGFSIVPVTLQHADASVGLPPLHSDPFDRMLIAQAIVEDLMIVSSDRRIADYGVSVIPARG